MLSIVSEDFFFPDSSADRATEDISVAVEWSSGFITVDAASAISWTQIVDLPSGFTSEWQVTISADTVALLETTTTAVGMFVDAEMPVDWTLTIFTDLVIEGDIEFSRKTIGASLEPDDWEADHGS